MKKVFCFILFYTIFLLPTASAQTNAKHILFSEKIESNLKDSVKSLITYYTKINENLPRTVRNYVLSNNSAFLGYKYLQLDRNGHATMKVVSQPDFGIRPFNLKAINVYYIDYDITDIKQKMIHTTSKKRYPPLGDYYLLIQPNNNFYFYSKDFDKSSPTPIDKKTLTQSIFEYMYDNKGRVKEQLEYLIYPEDSIPIKKYKKENLNERILFNYNDKSEVVNQKIILAQSNEDLISSSVFNALSTESGFCNDLQLKYKYDNQGRMTQALFYGNGETISKEDYSYHPSKDYIEKVKYYVTGPGEMSNPTKNFIKTFNEQGDMISKEFIPDSPEQAIVIKQLFYSYEYDSHNNWIKCSMFLEGTPNGEPTLVAERKIEYYN